MGGARLIDGRGRLPKPVPIFAPAHRRRLGRAGIAWHSALPRRSAKGLQRTNAQGPPLGCRTRRRSSASTPQGKGIRRSQAISLGLNNGHAMASCQDCGQHQRVMISGIWSASACPVPFSPPQKGTLWLVSGRNEAVPDCKLVWLENLLASEVGGSQAQQRQGPATHKSRGASACGDYAGGFAGTTASPMD
jgi:hypothetical protein